MLADNFAWMSTSTFHSGIFYMPQICDMRPTGLLPLWRKARWRFSRPKKSWRLWPGLNPRTWVLKGSMLPLDHQSHLPSPLNYGDCMIRTGTEWWERRIIRRKRCSWWWSTIAVIYVKRILLLLGLRKHSFVWSITTLKCLGGMRYPATQNGIQKWFLHTYF